MLSDILNAVNAQLKAVVKDVRTPIGAKYLATHDQPPRVAWVPTNDFFGGVETPGANPRPIRTRQAGVDAHVWGATFAGTEQLAHQVIAAVHGVARGSYEVTAASWAGQDGAVLSHGDACVLSFTFAVPVTDRAYTTVTLETVSHSETIDSTPP